MGELEYFYRWHKARVLLKWYAFKFRRYASIYGLLRRMLETSPTFKQYMECSDNPITVKVLTERKKDVLQSAMECEGYLLGMYLIR